MVHGGTELEKLIDFSADLDSRRSILSAIVRNSCLGLSASELKTWQEAVSQLGEAELSALRQQAPHASVKSTVPEFDFSRLIDQIRQHGNDEIVRQRADVIALLGLELRERQDPLLSTAGIMVHEVCRSDGAVIAEGKATSIEGSISSALGEALERAALEAPDMSDSLFCSPRQLEAAGIKVPSIDLGYYDCFHHDLPMAWIPGRDSRNTLTAVPADLVSISIEPFGPAKVFAFQSTAGAAAGPTLEFAAYRALVELIETDAYALHVRLGIYDEVIDLSTFALNDNLAHLIEAARQNGLIIKAFLIQFDHLFPIVHCVLSNASGCIPSLSHGLGSGDRVETALRTALIEAVQVFSDMTKIAQSSMEESLFPSQTVKIPEFFWIDPANKEEILTSLTFKQTLFVQSNESDSGGLSLQALIDFEEQHMGRISFFPMGSPHPGQHVVRAHAEHQVVLHDLSKRPQRRIARFMEQFGITRESKIPILT